jgi:hypothetical protein
MTRFSFAISMATAMTVVSISVPALSAELDKSIIGTWIGPLVESCQALRDQTTDDYLIFAKKSFKRHEGECVVTNYSRTAKTHALQFLCETEGETVGGKMKITVLNSNKISIAGAGEYARCK